ncbi:hypothetical protein MSG28_001454 [Choristoneura fumiferana]|uniref:Uncharacterized protein n=1 Tax=Choristoneura fumiferana TaxID=7141 RepID=A0ACC0KUM5_CHOFU|nr:hypothetical protein MSG28_001454 [Choristoneura fumiferana]
MITDYIDSLPSGLHVGRSNIRQVAERRFGDVQAFLTSLFSLADEIAHSDLVYTFFHPLLRDQQDVEPQRMKNRGESTEAENTGSGSLKLSVQYAGGVLSVLILHAQSLAVTAQGLPPNPYVKENTFLGGVVIPLNTLPLRQETVAWYPLEYIPR